MTEQTGLAEAGAAGDFAELPGFLSAQRGLHPYSGADAVAVRRRADASHLEPVITVPVVPVEEIRTAALPVGDEEVEEAIIIIIAPGRARRVASIIHHAAGCDLRERTITIVVVERFVLTARVRRKQIEKSIVVVVGPQGDFGIL